MGLETKESAGQMNAEPIDTVKLDRAAELLEVPSGELLEAMSLYKAFRGVRELALNDPGAKQDQLRALIAFWLSIARVNVAELRLLATTILGGAAAQRPTIVYAPNGGARYGEEYGQEAAVVLGLDECHRRAMRCELLSQDEIDRGLDRLKAAKAT
jgi:hypothetical protein